MTNAILYHLAPEIVLIATAVSIYLAGAFTDTSKPWSWIAGGGIALAAIVLGTQPTIAFVGGSVAFGGMACYGRWLALGLGLLLVLMSPKEDRVGSPEYVGSLLLAIVGLMVTALADNLVLLFVGLELISIPTYIMLSIGNRNAAGQESAAKYFFLSILASVVLLYGLCFFYGATGTMNITAVRDTLPAVPISGWNIFGMLAMVLIFGGVSFKIAAVPFHFYAPDVYQGTSQVNAALLSVVPKAAGFLALIRLLVIAVPVPNYRLWHIVAVVALLTMTLGNVLALWQVHLRRLMAYSSIANAGYMLIALAVASAARGTPEQFVGINAILFYLLVYSLASIGTFAALEHLGSRERPVMVIEQLNGLARVRPLMAAMIAVFMFSLTGIPILAGFWGKLFIFWSALSIDLPSTQFWFVFLAVLGVLNAAISAAYYLRIVGVMYFRTPLGAPAAQGGLGPWLATAACCVLVIGIGVMPDPLIRKVNIAVQNTSAADIQRSEIDLSSGSETSNLLSMHRFRLSQKNRHSSLPHILEWRKINIFRSELLTEE